MDTNKLSLLISLLVTLSSTFFATCKKNECIGKNYSFKTNWAVKQEIDSVSVGDTITLFSKLNQLDHNSNQNIVLGSNTIVGTPISIAVLRGLGVINGAVDSFDFVSIKGRITTDNSTSPKSIMQLFYQEYSSNYEFEFSIIAKKRGIYALGIPDAIVKKEILNGCNDGGAVVLENNNLNNNMYYYQNLYYQGSQVPINEVKHGFCFKVK